MNKLFKKKMIEDTLKSIPDAVKKEVSKLLRDDEADTQKMLETFIKASEYQQSIDQMERHKTHSLSEFKRDMASISKHLSKSIKIIEDFTRIDEGFLDEYHYLANKNEGTLLSRELGGNRDSRFLSMLKSMEKAIAYYQMNLRQGKQPDHRYSWAISIIIKAYIEIHPDKNPMGKQISDEFVVCKLISEWLYGVHLTSKERKSVKAKVEAVTLP